ncbi:MAG: DNA methyltransferase [Kiritimatiellae bacterium]|nr:DNA methyltransferase [Kiritimatiellia bacterium]
MPDYIDFLETKRHVVRATGFDVEPDAIHPLLFPFQRDLTRWALRKGSAAIFADTGLGKTFMQLEWARLTGARALIVAPLSVARQTVGEARKIGLDVHYTRAGDDLIDGINITNYEMIEAFNPADFGAVVLDESSILKSITSKTRGRLIAMFADTPYRLCCTATPAPNDIAEIANHAEFLGVMPRVEMLATFFVHDDDGWRLKRHAVQPFFRWMASWAMSVRKPSDLGYDNDGFILPPLDIIPHWVETEYAPEGQLFFTGLKGVSDRAAVRRETMAERVQAAADLINNDLGHQWIAWRKLLDEGRLLHDVVPDSILVEGSMSPDEKLRRIEAFQDGVFRVLITEPKIAGFGMNFQNATRQVFVGLGDSWESYYQCVRRSWRFGQARPVKAYIVLSDIEDAIYENVMRKDVQAKEMAEELIKNVQVFEREELNVNAPLNGYTYETGAVAGDDWRMLLGDSAERLREMDAASVDLSVFSPPFMSLYTYSPTERDLGNSRSEAEFFTHFGFIIDELRRVTKPGRNCAVHVAQIPAMQVRDGYIGLKDFRGKTIQAFEDHGWIFHGEVAIDKDPQAQAIRTKSKALLFVQLHKDASWSRPALADFILVFRKPGENAVPIKPHLTNDEWIEWARPIWYGISESDTLQYHEARGEDDERHICPLQLGTIERVVRLWSNPGETVLSPFAGIGSEGHVALCHGRKFVGIELKPEYFEIAVRNLREAEAQAKMVDLFAFAGVEVEA